MTASAATPRNRLAAESSPYLLQHAANPVDWYPWGPEALARARQLDRPILLSIGYSACHWCHVMAHESFEDSATARTMNELYVNVKVDREERPDLDRIYQLAHQLLTQRGGGWPLTMFLTPEDQAPFFGGTYFPREARHGMPAFRELLEAVARYFRERRDEIRAQNGRLLQVFDQLVPPTPAAGIVLDPTPLDAARAALERAFDAEYGGFTPAPKFPHPGYVERLLRHWHSTAHTDEPDLDALYMATLTLARMAEGGLYDHVGGGFARYSTDACWMIPHFEKMLYDNGPLLALYADAAAATGEDLFRRTANGIADWALAEMQSPEGGFRSALDADSEGEEGRYYVWDRDAVRGLLPDDHWRALALRYGLDREPNFAGRHWHLHAFAPVDEVARVLGTSADDAQTKIDAALATLARARATRVRPGLDDKILAGWNGLMIRGLAIASRRLRRPELATAATRAVDHLRRDLWRDGRLHASWKDGRVGAPGYLDDYAFLAEALLELLQARWRGADLAFAIELADALLEHFEDRERGGFWFTADDAEPLIHRPKTFADEALPAGNGVAARLLQRLGTLLGEPRYLAAAERALHAAWAPLQQHPHAHATLLDALEEWLAPIETVILRGTPDAIAAWQRELDALYAPRRLLFGIPADAADLPAALAAKRAEAGTIAYVCQGTACGPPVRTLARLVRRLRDGVDLATD